MLFSERKENEENVKKKRIFKKSCLTLKERTFSTYPVKYHLPGLGTEITLRRYLVDYLLKILYK